MINCRCEDDFIWITLSQRGDDEGWACAAVNRETLPASPNGAFRDDGRALRNGTAFN